MRICKEILQLFYLLQIFGTVEQRIVAQKKNGRKKQMHKLLMYQQYQKPIYWVCKHSQNTVK